jgi:hypothetical protein
VHDRPRCSRPSTSPSAFRRLECQDAPPCPQGISHQQSVAFRPELVLPRNDPAVASPPRDRPTRRIGAPHSEKGPSHPTPDQKSEHGRPIRTRFGELGPDLSLAGATRVQPRSVPWADRGARATQSRWVWTSMRSGHDDGCGDQPRPGDARSRWCSDWHDSAVGLPCHRSRWPASGRRGFTTASRSPTARWGDPRRAAARSDD